MSTHIKTIKGSYHKEVSAAFKVTHEKAEISLIKFSNGKKLGNSIQLNIDQEEGYDSYIHLTKQQCEELTKALSEWINQ